RQAPQPRAALGGPDGIRRIVLRLDERLDRVESAGAGELEFLVPSVARETLKLSAPWPRQPSLKNADHRPRSFRWLRIQSISRTSFSSSTWNEDQNPIS